MKRTALTVAAILTLVAGSALAQPDPGSPMQQQGSVPAKMDMPAMPEMTPEQQEKVDGLRMAQVKEMMPLRMDLRLKEMELGALWRAEKLDSKKIIAKVKEISEVRSKIALARASHRIAMESVLTPEQRRMHRRMGPMMGRGMGRRGMMRGMRGGMPGMMGMGPGKQGCCPEGPGSCDPGDCVQCEMH